MKTRLTDLNTHLFEQIERLNDEDLKGKKLKMEIKRAKAITGLAREVIATGQLLLDAHKAVGQGMFSIQAGPLPKMLKDNNAGKIQPDQKTD